MRAVIIGGTGHVGTYLVPRLVEAGYEVTNATRGQHKPYLAHAAWKQVRQIKMDRVAEEQAGSFGARIAALEPDVVIDMICFEPASAEHIVEALRGKVQHYLVCCSVWAHTPSPEAPTREDSPCRPIDDYGLKKAAIEAYVLDQARGNGFPATVVHPGHIVGPGHPPVNPLGNHNPEVFARLSRGEEMVVPNNGRETVHHVHADDVAQVFMRSLSNWSVAVGEGFFAVSPGALNLAGYCEVVAGWFGQAARLSYMPLDEWRQTVPEADAEGTTSHLLHSPCCSIAKAERLLGYQPRYTSLEAVYESVSWLIDNGVVDAPPLR